MKFSRYVDQNLGPDLIDKGDENAHCAWKIWKMSSVLDFKMEEILHILLYINKIIRIFAKLV